MSARGIRVTLLFALVCAAAGIALAATVSPTAGGALLLGGWLACVPALHGLGRASR